MKEKEQIGGPLHIDEQGLEREVAEDAQENASMYITMYLKS